MDIKHSQLVVLISAVFVFSVGFGIIIPVIPYITRSVGATAFDLGLLLAVFSCLQFFCGPLWGRVSDQIGRKPVIVVGLFGFSLAFTLVGFSGSLWMLFVAEVIGGFFSAGIGPAVLAFVADVTTPGRRARLMGVMGAVSGVGFIAGPFISSVLSAYGLAVPFFVASAISFLTMICCIFLIPESVSYERLLKFRSTMGPFSARKMILETGAQMISALFTPVGLFLLITLVISIAIAGFEGTFSYYIMDRFGLTDVVSTAQVYNASLTITGPEVIGLVFALMGTVSVICQGLLVGRAIEWLGEEKVIVTGLFIGAIGLLLMIVAGELGWMILSICIVSIGSGLIFPCLNTAVSRRTAEDRQGVTLGIMNSYGNMGRVVGPPGAGYAYVLNIFLPYLLSAVLMGFCAILLVVSVKNGSKKQQSGR